MKDIINNIPLDKLDYFLVDLKWYLEIAIQAKSILDWLARTIWKDMSDLWEIWDMVWIDDWKNTATINIKEKQ